MEQTVIMWIAILGVIWGTIKFVGQMLKTILVEPLDTSIRGLAKAVERLNDRFEEQKLQLQQLREEVIILQRDQKTLFIRYDELVNEVRQYHE